MRNKKLLISLIAILVVASGYFVWNRYDNEIISRISPTPTPDPYAGWQTYTNEEYGFSIKYPGDTSVNNSQEIYKNRVFLFEFFYTLEPEFIQYDFIEGMAIAGSVYSKSSTLTLNEFVEDDISTKLSERNRTIGNHYSSVSNNKSFVMNGINISSFEYKEDWQEEEKSNLPLYRNTIYFVELDPTHIMLVGSVNASRTRDLQRISDYQNLSYLIFNTLTKL